MAVGALETPAPWHLLWIAVPALGAVGYLGNLHRWRWGWLAPAGAVAWMLGTQQLDTVWAWMLVGGVASAALLGLARAQGVPASRGLWALLPLLSLAVAFPFSSLYEPTVTAAARGAKELGEQAFQNYKSLGLEGGTLGEVALWLRQATDAWTWLAQHLLPSLFFCWAAALVAVAVLLARRGAAASGRPLVARAPFAAFRLPEGAIWVLLVALSLVALRVPSLSPPGVNLALCVGLGYCLQGVAVLDFALLARGLPPGVIWILFLFVVLFAVPLLAVTSTGLGLADVWLDLRRSRPEVEREEKEA